MAVRVVSRLGGVILLSRADADAEFGQCGGRVGKAIDGLHQVMEWSLLVVIGIHVAAALVHVLVYRDRIMQRMLPE
jgi:cytochrome b561